MTFLGLALASALLLPFVAALNGRELKLEAGALPPLEPEVEEGGALLLPALSVGFVVLPGAEAAACGS